MLSYGVITICLNSESTVRRTIESVLEQEILPERYIFVDGGSTDRTVKIIQETGFARGTGPEFEILRQSAGGGIAQAWNMGLKRLATDIVFILNSDDWYEPDTARVVLESFERRPKTAIVTGCTRLVNEEENKTLAVLRPRSAKLFPFTNPIPHPSCFVRRGVYDRVGMFDERYRVSADYDFLYRCRKASLGMLRVRQILANMRWGGTTSTNRDTAMKETLEIGLRHCRIKCLPRTGNALRKAGFGMNREKDNVRDIRAR